MRSSVSYLLASTILLSACATVKTSKLENDAVAAGVSYYLPKRDVKFSGTRTLRKNSEIQKKLGKAKTELKSAKEAKETAKKAVATYKELLKAPGLSALRRTQISDEVTINTKTQTEAVKKIAKAEADIASLESQLTKFVAGNCVYDYSVKMELMPPTADTSQRLIASSFHNPFRDDEQKLVVTTGGLLSSADVTATDRTGDIIVELAGAVSAFAGGPRYAAESVTDSKKGPVAKKCPEKNAKFIYRFNPVDTTEVSALNGELDNAEWPFEIEPVVQNSKAGSAKVFSGGKKSRAALFYRTGVPVKLVLKQEVLKNTNNPGLGTRWEPVDAALVSLPQAGPISYIPMKSSAFVKTVDNVKFDNGILTSWTANRPSEILEIVRLPVRILKQIVSVPTEILQLKVDYSDKETSLSEAYAKQVEADTKMQRLNLCLNLAEEKQTDPMTCFTSE